MAIIRKIRYKKAIPEDAKIVIVDGVKCARFRHKTRTVNAPLDEGGKWCWVDTPEWYIRYKNAHGEWKRKKGYTDRRATENLAEEIQQHVDRKRQGIEPINEEHLTRPLLEHADDFKADLAARDVTPDEVTNIYRRVRFIIKDCGFHRIGDMAPMAVQARLAKLRKDGRSIQTSNHYLQSIKQFAKWLVVNRRAVDNPLAHLEKLSVETDRRHDRRAILPDEFTRLVAAAETGKSVEAVAGPDRAMLYILAAWTGFRRRELGSLTIRSFDLSSQSPVVRVQAAYSKNGRADEIPLHTAVVERLRAWLKTKGEIEPGVPLIRLQTSGGYWRKPSKMMKHDLSVAREAWIEEAESEREKRRRAKSSFLKYQDDDGLFADFHSNRHTFISNLGRAGVPLATAQKLARHSTPTLTSNVYTHLELSDKAAAIGQLPYLTQIAGTTNEPQTILKTGTDDELPPHSYESLATALPKWGHFGACRRIG